jgi:hypothetical protein
MNARSIALRHAAALAVFGTCHYAASIFFAVSASAQLLRPDSAFGVILAPLDFLAQVVTFRYAGFSVFLGWLLFNTLLWTLLFHFCLRLGGKMTCTANSDTRGFKFRH